MPEAVDDPGTGPVRGHALDREILSLALPALATLLAEPLLVLADTWIIGHLGTDDLGGLTLASSVLTLVVGLSIFLAYGTTATVARRIGAGDRAGALAGGLDGMGLALALGAVVGAALALGAPAVLGLYGAAPGPTALGSSYLRVVAAGLPAQLLMLAATGVLRGLQDTRTPLRVVLTINVLNVLLNVALVYGLGWGITGAATGTALAQWVGALIMAGVVLRGARRAGVLVRWRPLGVLAAARQGVWLVVRSASMQAVLLLTTFTAASFGTASLAAHQVVGTIWSTLLFALDAFAIAAQAMVGLRLGAGDEAGARAVLARVLRWGIGFGLLVGGIVAASRGPLSSLFSPDPAVQQAAGSALLVLAVMAPVGAIAFQLDGVLIGAGDARFLALAALVTTAVHAPLALTVGATGAGLTWLWVAFAGWMAARCIVLGLRTRSGAWLRLGGS